MVAVEVLSLPSGLHPTIASSIKGSQRELEGGEGGKREKRGLVGGGSSFIRGRPSRNRFSARPDPPGQNPGVELGTSQKTGFSSWKLFAERCECEKSKWI